MKIVVVTRTLNESHNIKRFMRGYEFADEILVSDGGSTDDTLEKLADYPKVTVFDSPYKEIKNGYLHNPDNPNIKFIIDKGLERKPDFIILDDFDDVPNKTLRENARTIIENCELSQINGFRLYLWNDEFGTRYFPQMNNYFDKRYTSLWGWYPDRISITADLDIDHGTLIGLSIRPMNLELPLCLLHASWNSKTIDEKVQRYNAIGLPTVHPFEFAGPLEFLPEWANE